MKKCLIILSVLFFIGLIGTGCSDDIDRGIEDIGSENGIGKANGSTNENTNGNISENTNTNANANGNTNTNANANANGNTSTNGNANASEFDVDIDFTLFSRTIVEAEFQNIIDNSEQYMGKTIRVIGTYFPLFMAESGTTYHYIIIVAGDECCQLGFEFLRDGDYVVPDDYPAQGTLIEIIGVLDRYEEFGTSYIYLAVLEMSIVNR